MTTRCTPRRSRIPRWPIGLAVLLNACAWIAMGCTGAPPPANAPAQDGAAAVDAGQPGWDGGQAGTDAAAPQDGDRSAEVGAPTAVRPVADTDPGAAVDAGSDAASDTGAVPDTVDTASDPSPAAPLAFGLYAVQVSAVPGNPLACRVQWDTPQPADSVVSFGIDTFTLRARDPQLALHHSVLVYGLHAETTYRLVARSTTPQGLTATAPEKQYLTAPLPQGIQGAMVDVDAKQVDPLAWVLASVHLGQPAVGTALGFPGAAIAYDQAGYPVWFLQMPKSNNVLAAMQPGGQVMVMAEETSGLFNVAGDPLWQWLSAFDLKGASMLSSPMDGVPHHDMRLLPGGRVARLEFDVQDGKLGDRIVELDESQKVLWSWSTLDQMPGDDWPGLNSLRVSDNENHVLVSARNHSRVYFIERKTGAVQWSAGPGGSLKLQATPGASWFSLQHDAQLLANGNLLVYDNGLPKRGYSRVVEYELDAAKGTATQVWECKGKAGEHWYSAGEGSAERWEDGRTLVAAPDYQATFPALSRIMVFAPDGELEWQIRLTPYQGKLPVVYRASKMVPPGLEPLAAGAEP